jgi:Phage integrase family
VRTAPEAYATRAEAERALWTLAEDGRADCRQDLRYRALVLLATFASLRWGEATALRRCDIELRAGTVRVRASFAERSNGQIVLGPPKSKAGTRVIGIPKVIRPVLGEHLSMFVGAAAGALLFPGAKGGPLRRGNFNKQSGWPHAAVTIGAEGLHFHDLRHTGNAFAAASGAGLRDLMVRMGTTASAQRSFTSTRYAVPMRPSPRLWMPTSRPSRPTTRTVTMPQAARSSRQVNCTLIARGPAEGKCPSGGAARARAVTCGFCLERVTRIELALSAWEADVLPLNYTRKRYRTLPGQAWRRPGRAAFAPISYRNR